MNAEAQRRGGAEERREVVDRVVAMIYMPGVMAEAPRNSSGKRRYRDWYKYESRKTTPAEAFWMTVFTIALCAGFPLGFAALFRYGVPLLAKLF